MARGYWAVRLRTDVEEWIERVCQTSILSPQKSVCAFMSLRKIHRRATSVNFATKPCRHHNSFGDPHLGPYHGVMETKPSRRSLARSGRTRGRPWVTVHRSVELRGGTRVGAEQMSLPIKDERSLPGISAKGCLFLAYSAHQQPATGGKDSSLHATGKLLEGRRLRSSWQTRANSGTERHKGSESAVNRRVVGSSPT